MEILKYSDFCNALLDSGFSMGGGNANGIFALISYTWEEQDSIDTLVKWHTGDPETDPWEWRMRVLEERKDIAYAKLFFRTSGYITKDWYPYFLSVRRNDETAEEAYENGTLSQTAKHIYDIIEQNGRIPLHEIKGMGEFRKEDKSKFERAMVELQTRMFITMCGRAQKRNKMGEPYGWSSTVFCTAEEFFPQEVFERAGAISQKEAAEKITEQIFILNPEANKKKINKFIKG